MTPSWTKLILLFTIYAHEQLQISALNVNLSSLWNLFGSSNNDEANDIREKLTFPRRDLVQELGGVDEYQSLVNYALGLEENDNDNKSAKEGEDDIDDDVKPLHYGVDISFPMQHDLSKQADVCPTKSDGSSDPAKDALFALKQSQKRTYYDYIEKCNKYYTSKKQSKKSTKTSNNSKNQPCNQAEQDRFDMNLNQPPVMQNYTMLGFQKTTIPKDLQYLLKKFWKNHQMKQKIEIWDKSSGSDDAADTHVNHWSSPTYMVHIDNPYLEGGGMELKNYIWHVARQKLEDWINNGGGSGSNNLDAGSTTTGTGGKLTLSPTSLYGIRVYKENSILAPHVDRLPLVTSAIINVDQDVDEEWPLEVIGHDGVAYNITMKPGDMILYESHSVIHGRPYPLKGRYYANIFVHFEPTGHCIRHADRFEGKDVDIRDAKDLYERAKAKLKQKHEDEKNNNAEKDSRSLSSGGMDADDTSDAEAAPSTPAYIAPGSLEEKRWNQELEYKMDLNELKGQSTNIHTTAGRGNLAEVMYAFQLNPAEVLKKDGNGWQPLHEAVRAGHLPVVKFLIEEAKANKDARTGPDGLGASPLWWAMKYHDVTHPVVVYLKELDAVAIEPDAPKNYKPIKVQETNTESKKESGQIEKNEDASTTQSKKDTTDATSKEDSQSTDKKSVKVEL